MSLNLPSQQPLQESYDVVIIGGGAHGLACAYELAKHHGLTNVAVLEPHELGGDNRATVLRANYLTPEGERAYHENLTLYEGLSEELDFNVRLSRRGHLILAQSEASLRTLRWRAELHQIQGANSSLLEPSEIKQFVPHLEVNHRLPYPVMGALYFPSGCLIDPDAVTWGYARQARQLGVQLHPRTAVTAIEVAHGRVVGVQTNHGRIKTRKVLNALSSGAADIASMVGLELPLKSRALQSAATESLQPFLDLVIMTENITLSQNLHGELVMTQWADSNGLEFMEQISMQVLQLFPSLAKVKLSRQWTEPCDVTLDNNPITGITPIEGFFLDVGWGADSLTTAPATAKRLAALIKN